MVIKKGGSAPKVKHNDDIVDLRDDVEGRMMEGASMSTQLQRIGHEEGALRRRRLDRACMHGWWV